VKSLVFWGGGPPGAARRRHEEGQVLLLWNEDRVAELRSAGVPFRAARAYLTADEADRIDEAAIAWTKEWGRRPLLDGRSFRELARWKDVSLWWFAEIYLHHTTASPRYVRLIESFFTILEIEKPGEVEAVGLAGDETVLLGRACTARGVLFHGPRRPPRLLYARRTLAASLESRWNTAKSAAAAAKSVLTGSPPRPGSGGSTVLFLSHAAFWRTRRDPQTRRVESYEHYFDRLVPEVAKGGEHQAYVVAVGPRAAFRRRGLGDRLGEWLRPHRAAGPYVHLNRFFRLSGLRATLRGTAEARAWWRRLRRSPAVHQAFSHRGVSFADMAGADLARTMLLQLPWAVRSYAEIEAALAAVRPGVACLYAESSAWGRVAVAACRAAGVPTVAVQHGILYPKYYGYRHEADEADCPRPDRTAVFGEAAKRLLVKLGGYDPDGLVLTGSPRFDDLLRTAEALDREAVRRRLGVGPGERLLVVASRYRGIRETHQSIGSAFESLVRAVEASGSLRCLVKPHPAERPDAYQERIRERRAVRTQVLPAAASLVELLHAADALVTVESLSAIEALVLGRPVLILNMPTNLRGLVDQGMALGVEEGEDPGPALTRMLFDPETRERLARAREFYLSDVALGVDGRATERIVGLIRSTARGSAAVPLPPEGSAEAVRS
jgi:CDP-Glycerol:Poly(glycerophosphate) glycerophosphotransferase